MKNILEELWYGNIIPMEQSVGGNAHSKKLINLMGKNRENLSETLNDSQKELLAKYDYAVNEMYAEIEKYRKRAVRIMNDKTAHTLRKLKDSNGNYLWNHSDSTILGRPVEYSEFMPDAENGCKPIAFDDLSYYWIVERQSAMV